MKSGNEADRATIERPSVVAWILRNHKSSWGLPEAHELPKAAKECPTSVVKIPYFYDYLGKRCT